MDLYTLTTNIIFGATAGYITNNFAIKMLFKEYGPLGGVILKTKDEFIKNTSQLIEREIVNHHTLENKLESEELKLVINRIVKEIISEKLPQRLEKKNVKDIPEMENTISNIIKYVVNKEDFSKIDKKYQISSNIFEKDQLEYIISNLFDQLGKELKTNDNSLIDELSNIIYEEIANKKINELIDNSLLDKLENNLNKETKNIDIFLKSNFDKEIESYLNDIYNKLKINQKFKKAIQDFIKENNDIIDDKSASELLSVFIENIILVLKSNKGQEEYNKLIENLIIDLNHNFTFADIIGIKENEKNRNFIKKEKDYFFDLMKYWLEYNEEDIEGLLDETLMEVLEGGSGFQNSLQKFLYSFLGEEGVAKYEPVDKMNDYLKEKKEEIDSLSELKKLIKKYGPGDLLQLLFENDILTVNNLINILENNKKRIINYLVKNISSQKITNYLINFFSNLADNDLQDLIIKKIKGKYLYSSELTGKIENLSSEYISNLKDKKVKDILNQEIYNKYSQKVNKIVLRKLDENEKEIINFFVKYSRNSLNETNKYLANINTDDFLLEILDNFLKITEEDYWKKAVQLIENNENFSKKSVESLITLLEDNLAEILDGKIEETVSSSLYKLNDEDLQSVVEDFVGKELKPITIFGGGLGALGGILLYFLENLSSISPVLSSGPILAVLIYALIGYLTNVIAIWMIFHPYQEKNLFSYSLPLTPGVVAQNKDRFAQSMGEFVDNQLLNANSVTQILGGKKDDLIEKIQKLIEEDKYKRVENLLKNNSKKITEIISKNLFKTINNNQQRIAEIVSNKISNLEISTVSNMLKNIDNESLGKLGSKYLADIINSEIKELKHEEKSITELLKQENYSFVEDKINDLNQKLWDDNEEIINLEKYLDIDNINKEKIKKLIKDKINQKLKPIELNKINKEYISLDILKLIEKSNMSAKLLNNIIQLIFNENRELIKRKFLDLIKNKIKENNSFLGSLMFNLSGIDELADKTVDHFIDNKLADFLEEKEASLKKVAEEFLDDIQKTEMKETGLYIKDDFNDIIANNGKKLKIEENIVELNNLLIDKLFQYNKNYYIRELSFLEKINSHNLIKKLGFNLNNSLTRNKKEIKNISFKLINKVFRKKAEDIKLKDILADISYEELYYSLENGLNVIDQNKLFNFLFDEFNLIFADQKLKSFIIKDKLNNSIEKIINENKENMKEDLKRELPIYLNNFIQLSEKETLDYFSLLFLEISFDSLENNFIDLINAFEIKEITESEVEAMTSEEIEDLFYSFAGKYMNRLKIYGFSGGSFGFISEIILKYLLS